MPKYSVIIATHGRSQLLARAIRSVKGGGAPGPAHSRNVGLSVVDSDYVLFLDDDDEFSANYLHIIYSYIDKNANSVRLCDYFIVNDEENRSSISNAPVIPVTIGERGLQQLYVQNYIPNNALIYPLEPDMFMFVRTLN